MKKISSGMVVIYRYLYPISFSVAGIFFFLAYSFGMMRENHGEMPSWYEKWIVLFVGILMAGWTIYQAMCIQDVQVDDQEIIVSGLRGVERILFEDINLIEETRFRNPKLIILHLRNKSKFGSKILFIPQGKGKMFGTHPIVAELNSICRNLSKNCA